MGRKNFWVKQILGPKMFGSKKNWGKKKFEVKKNFGQKNAGVKKIFWSKNFCDKKCWVRKIFGSKILWVKKIWFRKIFCLKKPGRVNLRGRIYDRPPQKTVGLKLCCVDVSFVRWGRLQNFRPLGPLFLVEVEFLGVVGGMNSNNRVKPNQVEVRLSCR